LELPVNFLKRLPILPTLLVLAAVAVMLRLGFWQIDRMQEKNALVAQYAVADKEPVFQYDGTLNDRKMLFRRVEGRCRMIEGGGMVAGRNAKGETGWAHTVNCFATTRVPPNETVIDGYGGSEVLLVIGWSREPREVRWVGGSYSGVFAPGVGDTVRIIADPPLAGLEANARPDPANVPNNHWSYAIQWFLFALTALVIYGLAVSKRLKQH
jgi:surfeit locus 1 family protein